MAKVATVEAYLKSLPEDRRIAIETIRKVILKNLPKGYEEGIQYGMIGYFVPHSVYPAGYHCDPSQPLPFAHLASQKNHMAVYLMCIYGSPEQTSWFVDAWKSTGKRLDMSCVRFKKLEDAAVDVIGQAIKKVPVKKFIDHYEKAFLSSKPAAKTKKAATKKVATKKVATKKVATKKVATKPSSAKKKPSKQEVKKGSKKSASAKKKLAKSSKKAVKKK